MRLLLFFFFERETALDWLDVKSNHDAKHWMSKIRCREPQFKVVDNIPSYTNETSMQNYKYLRLFQRIA